MKHTARTLLCSLLCPVLLTGCAVSATDTSSAAGTAVSVQSAASDGSHAADSPTGNAHSTGGTSRNTSAHTTSATRFVEDPAPWGTLTSRGDTATFVPYKTDDVLLNPDMGWVLLDVAEYGRQDMGSTGDYPLVQNVGILTGWSMLEPQEGKFNWTMLDSVIRYWEGKGKRIHFRIATDCFPYYGASYTCPEWVYAAGVASQEKQDWGGQPVKYPDYTSPIYREKLQNFLTAYAKKYSGLASLDVVDLRGYGEWGEWHSGYQYSSWNTRVNALRWILDSWCSAWNGQKMLFLSYSHETEYGYLTNGQHASTYEQYLEFSALDYALEKHPASALGFRRDGVAGAITAYEKRFSGTLYQENRVQIAEFCNGYAQYKQQNQSIRSCINQALELHPNYMVLMGWDKNGGAKDFYANEQEEIKYALKNMGYRMVLESASFPISVSKGQKLTVSTDWYNEAFGVLPDGYTLQAALYDANGRQAVRQTSADFRPDAFSKNWGDSVRSTTVLDTSTLPAGQYTLCYAILDADGRPILLPHKGQTTDGFYKIDTLTIV